VGRGVARSPSGRRRPPGKVGQRAETARGVALAALVAAEAGARSNVDLPARLESSGLDERDRAFATELVYGTLRMLRACDWLIAAFAGRELEPAVRAAARAGVYQLVFMRVPAYAAVSATVEEGPRRARPLLNAVLRRVADLAEKGPVAWPDLATKLSYPDWVVDRLVEDLGEGRALAALEQMNRPASAHVRPDGYIQDPASQMVGEHLATLLDKDAPGWVIDLCSAPGGKATLLARASQLLVAADVDPQRAGLVAVNAGRLHLSNIAVVVGDGTAAPFAPARSAAVLVDAPCSGLGVLQRRPDARWRCRPGDIARLAALQKRLVREAATLVRPGGLLAYSVCTLSRAETVEVDQWLERGALDEGKWHPARPPGPPWEPLGRGVLLLPQTAGTDGMYMLVLRRGS